MNLKIKNLVQIMCELITILFVCMLIVRFKLNYSFNIKALCLNMKFDSIKTRINNYVKKKR